MSKKMTEEERLEESRFKTIEDFKWAVGNGAEVLFEWKDKDYVIGHPGGLIYICEAYTEKNAKEYQTVDEALEYMIDCQKLKEIITKVDVFDRTI